MGLKSATLVFFVSAFEFLGVVLKITIYSYEDPYKHSANTKMVDLKWHSIAISRKFTPPLNLSTTHAAKVFTIIRAHVTTDNYRLVMGR